MYNLTYKTPYHDEIREKLEKYPGHHWEPAYKGSVKGGAKPTKVESINASRIMHSSPWEYVPGREISEDRHEEIKDKLMDYSVTGGVSFKKIAKKGAKVGEVVGSTIASIGLDITFDEGAKAAAVAAGAEIGVPPFLAAAIGKAVGKFARKHIEKKTGLGRRSKDPEYYAKQGLSVGADILLKDALPEVTDYVGKEIGVPKTVSKAVGKKTGNRLRKKLKEKTGIGRKPNPWVAHVKKFAKEHGMNYSKALKDPRCKASYKSRK